MRQQLAGIDKRRMTTSLLAGHADGFQPIHQVLPLTDALLWPVLTHTIVQPNGQTLHGATFQAPIGGESFLHQAKGATFSVNIQHAVIFKTQQPPHLCHCVFLGRHSQTVGVFARLPGNLFDRPAMIALLPLLNKVSIFSKPGR